MSKAELGSGGGGLDSINVFDVTYCPEWCPIREGTSKFRCVKHNGDSTIYVYGGIDRDTLDNFKETAPCTNEDLR